MPGRGDQGLDRCHAPAAVLTVSFGERGRVPGKAPGNAHQRVAVLGQSLPRYPARAVHRGRLVERWGEAGGGVQVRGIGVSVDRKTVRGEPGGADDRDTGQRDQHLAGGACPRCAAGRADYTPSKSTRSLQ